MFSTCQSDWDFTKTIPSSHPNSKLLTPVLPSKPLFRQYMLCVFTLVIFNMKLSILTGQHYIMLMWCNIPCIDPLCQFLLLWNQTYLTGFFTIIFGYTQLCQVWNCAYQKDILAFDFHFDDKLGYFSFIIFHATQFFSVFSFLHYFGQTFLIMTHCSK